MAIFAEQSRSAMDAAPVRALAVRTIGYDDVFDSLRDGWDDYIEHPSHYGMLAVIYPLVGIALGVWTSRNGSIASLYPLVSGFALVGPLAALGFYEISRRRAAGLDASWNHVLGLIRSPRLRPVFLVGLVLGLIFLLWMAAANALYGALMPASASSSVLSLLEAVVSTPGGWALVVLGNLLGLGFAILAFSVSVVSLPLLLDRHVGFTQAVATSLAAVRRNPLPMALWGGLVALLLTASALTLFVGLLVVIPVLGHATFWLYRRVVV